MSDVTRKRIEFTHLVEEGDGVGLPALLPADAVLDPALDGLGAVDRHLDELAHALWVLDWLDGWLVGCLVGKVGWDVCGSNSVGYGRSIVA